MTRFTIEPITDNRHITQCTCGIECHAHCRVGSKNDCLMLPSASVIITNTGESEEPEDQPWSEDQFGVPPRQDRELALCEYCLANYVSRLIT